VYSISVFFGVLVSSYLMMSKDNSGDQVARSVQPPLRSEASSLDPAVSQLFEMEDAISKLPKDKEKPESRKRVPSEAQSVLPENE
jgi:hypothetical protein